MNRKNQEHMNIVKEVKEFIRKKESGEVITMDDIEIYKTNQRILAIDLYMEIVKAIQKTEQLPIMMGGGNVADMLGYNLKRDIEGLTDEEVHELQDRFYTARNYCKSLGDFMQNELRKRKTVGTRTPGKVVSIR